MVQTVSQQRRARLAQGRGMQELEAILPRHALHRWRQGAMPTAILKMMLLQLAAHPPLPGAQREPRLIHLVRSSCVKEAATEKVDIRHTGLGLKGGRLLSAA